MKRKKKRSEKYEPLVKTDLSFDELLKLSAHTSISKTEEKKIPIKKIIIEKKK
jgi:hypothetical protein